MKLWVDDTRPAPTGWTPVVTAASAMGVVHERRLVWLALDNDLGQCNGCSGTSCLGRPKCRCCCHLEGYDVLLEVEKSELWPERGVVVLTNNPAARSKMETAIELHYGRLFSLSDVE